VISSVLSTRYVMVTNHLRAPYGVYFTKNARFYGARTAPGRRQEESYDFLSIFRHRTVPGEILVLQCT